VSELAYVVGVLLGDGTLTHHHNHNGSHYEVRLNATSLNFVNFWTERISRLTGKRPIRFVQVRKFPWKPLYTSKIYSKQWFGFLMELRHRFINGQWTPLGNSARALVKGFYDSEGSHSKGNAIRLSNKNLALLDRISELLAQFGIRCNGPYPVPRAYNLAVSRTCTARFLEEIGRKNA